MLPSSASADITKSVQPYWLCKTPTPFGVGVFFCGRPDVSAEMRENGVSHSRGGHHRVSGLDALRAPTPVVLPSSPSADICRLHLSTVYAKDHTNLVWSFFFFWASKAPPPTTSHRLWVSIVGRGFTPAVSRSAARPRPRPTPPHRPPSSLDFTAKNGYFSPTAHPCGEFVKKISKNPKKSQKVLDFLIYIWYS